MRLRTEALREFSIASFVQMRALIDLNPAYQRESDVWKIETRAVLIDSIINGLDLPKIYLEDALEKKVGPTGLRYQYAVIDGKQRLSAILDFADGRLALAEDFYFFEDESVKASKMNLMELDRNYPELADRFWAYVLPIVVIHASSDDLIEEMFQRLNASTSLNAAEKRNSIQGPTREAVNRIANHRFLTECSPIRNARYKYRELAAKFLAIENQLEERGKVSDTKAATLMALFMATRDPQKTITEEKMLQYEARATATLDKMAQCFELNDPLLRSIGTVVVYYLAFRMPDFARIVSRERLLAFEEARRVAAKMSDSDADYVAAYNARLRDYNAWVQSTNDGGALEGRANVLSTFVEGWSRKSPIEGLRVAEGGGLERPNEED